MKSKSTFIGISRLELSQHKYRSGALYLSAMVGKREIVSIDCRFFMERGVEVCPTKSGIRIYGDGFDSLRDLICTTAKDVSTCLLSNGTTRRLIARRCDDRYGKGIDFRYFRSSDSFTGWERRGIRLQDGDFEHLAQEIRESGLLDGNLPQGQDLFCGKKMSLLRRETTRRSRGREHLFKVDSPTEPWTPVGQALAEFLRDE